MPVRTLVIDDSATMRRIICRLLDADPDIEVVGEAGDAFEGREAIKRLDPDVVTLDIEMPKINGVDFLEKIMRLRPTPVVMVSTLTKRGADATMRALQLGAVDYVTKPEDGRVTEDFARLPLAVKAASRARLRPLAPNSAPGPTQPDFKPDDKIVAIGSSTGGVDALLQVLARFPANCPPTAIVQHMPKAFTASFAMRLDRVCAARVKEAEDGDVMRPGLILLAPGDDTHMTLKGRRNPRCALIDTPPEGSHRPAVNVLFRSVASAVGKRGVGVILTGMGRDGASGLLNMRKAGAVTLGQDESTSLIYGMPKAAFEAGAVQRQVPLGSIAGEVLRACDAGGGARQERRLA